MELDLFCRGGSFCSDGGSCLPFPSLSVSSNCVGFSSSDSLFLADTCFLSNYAITRSSSEACLLFGPSGTSVPSHGPQAQARWPRNSSQAGEEPQGGTW